MKNITTGIIFLLCMFVLAACAAPGSGGGNEQDNEQASSDGPVTINFWDNFTDPSQSVIYDEIIAKFEENNPDITVERTTMGIENLRNTLKPALQSNSGPDVFSYDAGPGYLGELATSGLALDLSESYEELNWNERFPDWINEQITYEGKQYGIGNEVELIGAYYNKEIFNELGLEVPETYDEFLEINQTIKDAGITPIAFANKEQYPAFWLESVFYTSFAGKEKIEAVLAGEAGFDQPEFIEGLNAFQHLAQENYVPDSPNALGLEDGYRMFYSGDAAMTIVGSWMNGPFIENMGENVGFFLVPPAQEDLPLSAPGGIGAAIVANGNTNHPEAAIKFMDFMFSEETKQIWYENNVIPPVDVDVDSLDIHPLSKEVVELANSPAGLSYNIDVLMPQNVNEATQGLLQQLIAEKISGEEVAERKQQELEAAIENGDYQVREN